MWGSELSNSGKTSLVIFSRLLVTHLMGMGFDFVFVLFLPSSCGFFFVSGHGISFFGEFQHPPVDDCSTASCDFGALAGLSSFAFKKFPYLQIKGTHNILVS